MTFQAKITEPFFVEPSLHNAQRRDFLTHKQNRTALGQGISNDVSDCLTLAGSWWTIENQTDTSASRNDGLKLAGITVENCLHFTGGHVIIEPVPIGNFVNRTKRNHGGDRRVTANRPAQRMIDYGLGVVTKVFPHSDFGKCKQADRRAIFHFPAIALLDRCSD